NVSVGCRICARRGDPMARSRDLPKDGLSHPDGSRADPSRNDMSRAESQGGQRKVAPAEAVVVPMHGAAAAPAPEAAAPAPPATKRTKPLIRQLDLVDKVRK